MAHQSPDLPQYRALCECAARILRVAPWEWMEESDLFGVRDPDTGELGFVSVMGMLGEHRAVAVYQGAVGLWQFLSLHEEGDDPEIAAQVSELPHLHLAFVPRRDLEPSDRSVYKRLGLRSPGRNAWPEFRIYVPGFVPRPLRQGEVGLLQHGLEQLPGVAERYREDESVLHPDGPQMLVRVPVAGEWVDRYETVEHVPMPWESVELDPFTRAALERLERTRGTLDIAFVHLWSTVGGEPGLDPFYVYMLLLVDGHTGLLVGSEVLVPDPTAAALWSQLPGHLARLLEPAGGLPATVRVDRPRLARALGPVLEAVGVELVEAGALPHLDELREGLDRFERSGIPLPGEPPPPAATRGGRRRGRGA
ncbi:MAG: hypothetical protein AB1505_18200 [Candidatus Latescibacterota bacterium]